MNEKVLRTLEYNKIIQQLAEKASSEPGRALCRELVPMTDLILIEQAQRETGDALSRLFRKGSTSFGSNKSLEGALRALAIGSTLSAAELLKIAALLDNVKRVKAYGRPARDDEAGDSLTDRFELLEPLTPLVTEIRRCILSEDEVADDASSGLRQVRRAIVSTGDKIHSQLNSMVNGSCRVYLQDAVITMRDNRYCLPVKSEYKNQVPGMVHDQSSSGSTFFIEPTAIVNLNNQLRELGIREQEEIEIVLADLSVQTGGYAAVIATDQQTMTQLDFIFAKASLALEQNATLPIFNQNRYINIRKGRHPLLSAKTVVPIDLYLGRDFDLLVVTGPNTGGKTVSLKTVGLFTLMGQAGLHIPALDRSELAIFREVYADIGDEQSIEQSLSTFSSHMTTIVQILAQADADSLCLFDELGAGTDPTEGAALAIAILNHLHQKGIRSIATTHYSELKVYALSTDRVQNASCEFDVETLRPTYRLLIGIPGKSNAFAISGRLGLPDFIIDAAKAQIDISDASFEDVLADLEAGRITIEQERQAIEAMKAEIKGLKEKLEGKHERIDNAKDRILRQAQEEAREILQEAKTFADESIRIFQKSGINNSTPLSIQELEQVRDGLRAKITAKNDKLALKPGHADKADKLKVHEIKPGNSVRIISMGLTGTVSTLPDHRGNLFVQCGVLRSQVNISDLVLLAEPDSHNDGAKAKERSSKTQTSNLKMNKALNLSAEINLLGRTVDEALAELDKYLDDAYLTHLTSVRVVHGKGTGALRNAVHRFLKRVKYVQSFRLGEYGEGDAGVTIVTFKES
ncbi:MAG: endonuclease MutS2 [Lachnospiraceae bacterium]|jgi:DNA mismatch repair protein MutS2|nr:endonuclease MutS2 [Lachnospiraceae bacterium]